MSFPGKHGAGYDPIAELVRVNPVPSMIVDTESLTIAVVNRAASDLLRYSEQELIGKSLLDLVPAEDVSLVQQASDEPPPEGETFWRCFTKTGALLYVKLKYRETFYRNKPARFVVALESRDKPFNT